MRKLLEKIMYRTKGAFVYEAKDVDGGLSWLTKFKEKHGIVSKKLHSYADVHSIGFSEKEKKWYGWSHRAIVGFGIGDKIFEPDYGDENTVFTKHGSKTIKNMDDAEKSARAFANYVS